MHSPLLAEFALWLDSTEISLLIRNTEGVVPLLQSIHILAVAVVIWAGLAVNLRTLGLYARSESSAAVAQRHIPPIWWSLIILLSTGVILIIGEPQRTLENYVFQIKMATLIVGITATFMLKRILSDAETTTNREALAKTLAVISIIAWVVIIFAGRWIAYV